MRGWSRDVLQHSSFIAIPNNPLKRLVFLVVLISLLGTVTNFVTFSALTCSLAFFLPMAVSVNVACSRLVKSIYWMCGYFVFMTIIYAPSSFLDYNFYRRDGNVFITFFPLLILGALSYEVDTDRWVRLFLKWVTGITLVTSLFFVITTNKKMFTGHNIFLHLFYSHNGAGGFLAVIASLCYAYFLHSERHRAYYFLAFIINASACVLTYSRGSVLGLVLALGTVCFLKERYAKYFALLALIATGLAVAWTYEVWLGNPLLQQGLGLEEHSEYLPVEVDRSHTVLDRLLVIWPAALHLWIKSPIFGTGFGSYNDVPYSLQGIDHVFMLNDPGHLVFNSSHAHHSFFHVLGETGMIGIALMVYMLVLMRRCILSLPSKALQQGLLIAYWVNIWSSMTEHRLFTPSQMLPFTIILGLVVMNQNVLDLRVKRQEGKVKFF